MEGTFNAMDLTSWRVRMSNRHIDILTWSQKSSVNSSFSKQQFISPYIHSYLYRYGSFLRDPRIRRLCITISYYLEENLVILTPVIVFKQPLKIPLSVSHFSLLEMVLLFSLSCHCISVMAFFTILVLVSGNGVRIMEGLTLSDSLVGALVSTSVSGAERKVVGFSDFFDWFRLSTRRGSHIHLKSVLSSVLGKFWMDCMGNALSIPGPDLIFGMGGRQAQRPAPEAGAWGYFQPWDK